MTKLTTNLFSYYRKNKKRVKRKPKQIPTELTANANDGNFEERDSTILLSNQSDVISHIALDIGGTLIKLVYVSSGSLHFVKFETYKINECLDFIYSNRLHRVDSQSSSVINVTGGGAYKFADLFKERLGISIHKQDEMDCLVAGANFLLKAIPHEAFTHKEGQKEFVQIDSNHLFPYLLVNIGSGVSILKVDGDGVFERVGGTMVGGGTYLALCKLTTKCGSFDELLELSQRGDSTNLDMLVGDITGGKDYNKIGLSSSTVASSFGKVISENKELEDCRPEDISLALLRLVSCNIAQTAYGDALRFGLKRIFFGGFFIRGHACTMDIISSALKFWSKGQVEAMFLRHEGFLGALGAFMSYEKHRLDDHVVHHLVQRGAPYIGGNVHVQPLGDLSEKVPHDS